MHMLPLRSAAEHESGIAVKQGKTVPRCIFFITKLPSPLEPGSTNHSTGYCKRSCCGTLTVDPPSISFVGTTSQPVAA
jgi:hypothetical protein